jgi:hypothetical protein
MLLLAGILALFSQQFHRLSAADQFSLTGVHHNHHVATNIALVNLIQFCHHHSPFLELFISYHLKAASLAAENFNLFSH